MFDLRGAGERIHQPSPDLVEMLGTIHASRILGTLIFLFSLWMVWSSKEQPQDLAFIFGVLLALFGLALATQRHRSILNRQTSTWYEGGDVFFLISFRQRGPLREIGTVRIGRHASSMPDDINRSPFITYPVTIEARDRTGRKVELGLGKHWSLDQARELATHLAAFLDRSVEDGSEGPESVGDN